MSIGSSPIKPILGGKPVTRSIGLCFRIFPFRRCPVVQPRFVSRGAAERPKGALECRGCRASGGFCSSGLRLYAASCDLEHRTGCRGRCVPVSRCIGRRIKVHATCLAWSSVATQTLHLQVPATSLSSPTTPQGRCATAHAAQACPLPHMPTIACPRYSLSTIWLRQARWSSWSTRAPTARCGAAFVAMNWALPVNVVKCVYVSVARWSGECGLLAVAS